MRIFYYIIMNLFMLAMLYLGLFQGLVWAENMAIILLWYLIILSFFLLFIPAHKLGGRKIRTAPKLVDITYDVGILIMLISQAWFWTAAFYLIQIINTNHYFNRIREVEKNNEVHLK